MFKDLSVLVVGRGGRRAGKSRKVGLKDDEKTKLKINIQFRTFFKKMLL